MAYYNDPNWSSPAPGRQSSWEQPPPPSRSGTSFSGLNGRGTPSNMDPGSSSTVNTHEANAFASQFEGTSGLKGNLGVRRRHLLGSEDDNMSETR